MNRVTILTSALICVGLISVTPATAGPSTEEVNACLKMIKDMVGVEPSPTVTKFCQQGKRDDAMKAAMAGE